MRPPDLRFDPFLPEVRQDPFRYYGGLRDTAPAFHTVLDGRDIYGILRHADVTAALANHTMYTATDGLGLHPRDKWTSGIVAADHPNTPASAKFLGKHLLRFPQALRNWQPTIQTTADHLVATLIDRKPST
jgi:cytochrome P450